MQQFETSEIARLASRFINSTNRHVFLTGKAGTGKTTFLKALNSNTHKQMVVAAPTGIAAINAGGITLHSLFQLPFGSFIPENVSLSSSINIQVNTPKSLMSNFQMHTTKRNMLRELELLVIDEVSMLRADLLDAIDTILRSVRRKRYIPFGGVQMLFIGDMLQLPPIVKDDEWAYLRNHYRGMYFFNARVLQDNPPVYLEMDKIYRQTHQRFIQLLNNLRENKIDQDDIALLNKYHQPDFNPPANNGYIYLTTHNRHADEKNRSELAKIESKAYTYHAQVQGDFNQHMYPIDEQLELKKGAQVMFIKNDYSGEQRYFNGKIGTISSLSTDEIVVAFTDGSEPAEVERYTWENKRYKLNPDSNEIEEEITGTFKHYPLKLAWAITVHKSQGLTFDKAVIDVSQAFAPGQIYVALSRLRSLAGLVLLSKIPVNALQQDENIHDYSNRNKKEIPQLTHELKNGIKGYLVDSALDAFDFNNLLIALQKHIESYDKNEKRSEKQKHKQWANRLYDEARQVKSTADKFLLQLNRIKNTDNPDAEFIRQRTQKAKMYFEPLITKLQEDVNKHIKALSGVKKIKKYQNELRELERSFRARLQQIYKAEALADAFINDRELQKKDLHENMVFKPREQSSTPKSKKVKQEKDEKDKKPNTKELSYNMFTNGKSVDEIANERGMVSSTIEGHLAHYVEQGKINIESFLQKEELKHIIEQWHALETEKISDLKEALDHNYTYGQLNLALAYNRLLDNNKSLSE